MSMEPAAQELEDCKRRLLEEARVRMSLEEQLHRAQSGLKIAAQEFEQFVYVTSHDLQGPLRNIIGFSQLLTRRYASRLDADGVEFMQFIEQGVRQMQGLIQGLLLLSRVGRNTGSFERRPLDESLRSALDALKHRIATSDARIEFGAMPEVPAVQSMLVALFQHLIDNAIKFRRPGVSPHVRVSAEQESGAVHLRVHDAGIGVPAEQLENIFIVFRRLHTEEEYEGTGMGLTMCRKIVQHHRGEIWAESDGEGSTVHVRLPLEPAAPT